MGQLGTKWPLARRDAEVDAVVRAFGDPARDAVSLYGPTGVGKTRLAETCLALAEGSGRLTARVVASRAAARLPLGALAPILPTALPADATPAALFEQAREELLALGGSAGLVLFIDDAHLLDASSALLLSQLLDNGAVFLMATIRDGEVVPDAVATWWRRDRTLRLDLADLDPEGSAEVLTLVLGGVVAADTIRSLHRASGGNPLLLRELVHQALEGGQLADRSGTWRLTGTVQPSRRMFDVLATRLAALSDPARRVVDQLAVCAPVGPAELTGEISHDDLVALERAGLISVVVDGLRHQLVLSHPIYGEALRAELTVLRRRAILLAAAERIRSLGARRREDNRRVATWLLDAGGRPDPELLLQATRFARYANDFAEVERLGSVLWEAGPTAEVAVLLGEAHYQLGHYDEAEAVLAAPVPADSPEHLLVQRVTQRGQNLQWGLSDWRTALAAVKEAQATLGPEHADDLVIREAEVWNFAAQPQKALDVVEQIAPRTPRARAMLAIIRGHSLCRVGRTAEAIEVAIEGFREHSALTEPVALSHPGVHMINQAYSLVEAGRFAEGDEITRFGYDVVVAENIPFAQIWFALMLGKSCSQQGRIEECRRWMREGASTAQVHGFRGPERVALAALAAAEAMLGNVPAATAAIARADTLHDIELHRFDQALGWAWTAWAEGDPERARRVLVESATVSAEQHNVMSAAWLWHDAARLGAQDVTPHLAALAARSDSPVVTARAEHIRALEADDGPALGAVCGAFEDLGMLLLAAEAASASADAHRRAGQPRPAANWAVQAQALARHCPGVRTPALTSSEGAVPLSAREREIADLAGRGLSSQEIADRLFLSIRTVNNHLGKVYAKLGVNKREELTEALTQG
ncbi:MAG: transcriptional regulator, LuxR family [Acidimicrobiales bacterium]|nr:transcriptional regulator, LuxR family [Acidimicrobiales bacterium]